ncbi:metallophosphoesterase [Pigmentibacter sp. JX0631]|uniref:metallophosphoesterase n=1 Tax=Pigmentibacter sp. JX0631 TaxID=2976982 RepID=UPI002468A8E8|nr:metallophosphoesterase [Pigmentibacter sp. JX0631]WGL60552.1 metallophosphoesterase [Pigmentibacter sp. JX0631]
MKKVNLIAMLSLFAVSCSTKSNDYQAEKEKNILAVSDIHYNPFSLCDTEKAENKLSAVDSKCNALMKELNSSKAEEWDNIFAKYLTTEKISSLKTNTNHSLYQKFLVQLETVAKSENIDFVVILGDFLTHGFHQKLNDYAKLTQQNEIESFIKKTFEYISLTVNAKLPKDVEAFPVIGNNDSYGANYKFDNPNTSSFYKDLSIIWGSNAKQLLKSKTFVSEGGYYSINLNDKKLSIVALNTNMLSKKAHADAGVDIDSSAKNQLNWLSDLLNTPKKTDSNEKATSDNKDESRIPEENKVLVISHIPNGIDGYASSVANDGSAVPFWRELHSNSYLNILKTNSEKISTILVGHTHHDGFQKLDDTKKLYSSSVPSLTAVRNNPGFKVFKLNKENVLVNSTVHYYDLNEQKWAENPKPFTEFSPSAGHVSHGYEILLDAWSKDTDQADEHYLKRFVLNADHSDLVQRWKHYVCAAGSGMTIKDFNDCYKKVTEKK